ncbi:hypothetical protein LguiA_014325 [Lonicera macranthoides]
MDSNLQSFPSEGAGTKAAFHKPSTDAANRRYRRRSPAGGSSSSDESPNCGRSSNPSSLRDDLVKVFDDQQRKDGRRDLARDYSRSHNGRNGDSYKYDQQSSRSSHSQCSYDDYVRRDKHADEGISKSSSHSGRVSRGGTHSDKPRWENECTRSKDLLHNVDKYAQETSSLDYTKYKDRDSLSDRPGYGRTMSNTEEVKTDRSPIYEASRGHRNDSSRWESSGRLIEAYGIDAKELEIKEDQKAFTCEDQESPTKKPKLSRLDKGTDCGKVSKFSTVADNLQSSSFKQGQELVGKASSEQDYAKESDIDAAKVVAMKVAELALPPFVNGGPGSITDMMTLQLKKLLWGSKKNTVAEEPAHCWDDPLFSDREQQEKFNKLMGLRSPWYLWPIVGFEGRPKIRRSQTQEPGGERIITSGETEGTSTGFGETVHCRATLKRWPHGWTRSLKINLAEYFWTDNTRSGYVGLYFCARNMFHGWSNKRSKKSADDEPGTISCVRVCRLNWLDPRHRLSVGRQDQTHQVDSIVVAVFHGIGSDEEIF